MPNFSHWQVNIKKYEGARIMKIFVQEGDRSYFLIFSKEVTQKDLKGILGGCDHSVASYLLARKSKNRMSVPLKSRRRARLVADFTLTESYTAERLA